MKEIKAKTISAQGKKGMILRGLNGIYTLRINQPDGNFIDYDLNHSDLQVEICDTDAVLYHFENGNSVIDHSPKTLGIKVNE